MSDDPKQPAIDVSELQYYFDAVERDSIDKLSHSRRSSEVLAIRDKLLALPDKDFEAAMLSIRGILNPTAQASSPGDERKQKRKDASDLYEQARAETPHKPLKVGAI